uniref:Uncharacterized protein n=1 Tax=Rhizophora mucronata TaxID=61149 RepID=A0A2P2PJT7_RHIMU
MLCSHHVYKFLLEMEGLGCVLWGFVVFQDPHCVDTVLYVYNGSISVIVSGTIHLLSWAEFVMI